jgi:mono/diheme cytochrome c family protein
VRSNPIEPAGTRPRAILPYLALIAVTGGALPGAWTAAAEKPGSDGAALYRSECAGCHGENGDGKGEADPELLPPPRDLTRGKFKLRSSNPRSPVSTDELFDTISNGIPGTAMPSYRFLSSEKRRRLAEHVRRFSVPDSKEPGQPVPVGDPPPATPELIEKGRQEYTHLGCQACHGPEGKGDGPAAEALKDEWGHPDPPRNLVSEPYRGGDGARETYLRLSIGMPGTPMPGYADVASTDVLWAVVAYLRSIRRPPPPPPSDPFERGKLIFESRHCRACHELDGRGGQIGPPLDRAFERLRPGWLRRFLADPRPEPKLYPIYPQRMPQLFLTPEEIDAVIQYLGSSRR